ncbi:hypothetical protein N4G70_28815 [Streptomyces sp. ASQP_92]|uniref:hypothetical protein n=1 Tax=Streptomyces sp. ASQP_92 TaxID=2979116 RepID=UPI0021C0F1C7|nr:hypothetical protein [Streptomyces sp. ASQP_92]MCT9092842.1 hypothetical protein [Streptomyces sp. ASQP_92]
MAGYTSPYVLLPFPDLGDDVSVLIRNPQLLPPSELTPEDVQLDDRGQPVDPQAANMAMYKVFARLIVAWKVYDASELITPVEIAEDADPVTLFESLETTAQPRLGAISPENIARLPMRIINRIGAELGSITDPK